MGSSTWGSNSYSLDTPSQWRRVQADDRPPAGERNGRTASRRPTRVLPGPPAWVQRRQDG